MTTNPFSDINAQVKVVIWDLDETFWRGTLSEGGISPIASHIEMIGALADRGIMSSICSKNDFEAARAELERLGVWDLFVFPHIDWTAKGQALKAQIEAMQLRPDNVLFIDDNPMNLEEARYFCPGLMCVDGQADLTGLLALDQLRGKNDEARSRLAQYKMMEAKQEDQHAADVSNIEFLRQSEIKLQFIWDLDTHWDRVLELINRTNQLNFIKQRAETEQEQEKLRTLLANPATHAGLVRVTDRYGDYGIVGFFLMQRRSSGARLLHFAFSCRTLHMGIEQWVYARLERPFYTYQGPTANGLDEPENVDWIEEVEDLDLAPQHSQGRSLCLVGGCDLMQMSFYCGSERKEFVNIMRNDVLVRYDEFGFFLNDRQDRSYDVFQTRLEMPTRQEMRSFDQALATSDLIVLSLYHAVAGDLHYRFGDKRQFIIQPPNKTLREALKSKFGVWITQNFAYDPMPLTERVVLGRKAIESALAKRRHSALTVLLSASMNGTQAAHSQERRAAYNALLYEVAAEHPNVVVLDVDQILDPEDFFDSDHYLRSGYYKMAQFINHIEPDEAAEPTPQAPAATPRPAQPPRPKAPQTPNTPARHPNAGAQTMPRILDTLYVTNPYHDAPLEDVAVDMQGWGSNHFLFKDIMTIVKPKTVVEVGTWKGMSAMHMADIAKEMEIEGFEICCVDTWLGSPGLWNTAEFAQTMLKLKNGWPMLYFTFMKNVIERNHQDVITPLPMPADMAHFVLSKRKVVADMIYVDAAHDYENCKRDLERYWELLAPHGILLGDDYDERHPGVIKAAHEFADERGMDIATTQGKFALSPNPDHVAAVKKCITAVEERRALALARRKAREEAEALAKQNETNTTNSD